MSVNKFSLNSLRNHFLEATLCEINRFDNQTLLLRKQGAKRVLGSIKFRMSRLSLIFSDNGYRGKDLQEYLAHDGYKIEIITRNQKAFKIQPKRWFVERTLARIDQNSRVSKDYERYSQTSELLIEIYMIYNGEKIGNA